MEENVFLQKYLNIIWYLHKVKNTFSGTNRIESWKFNGISEESIENITKSGSNFAPTFVDHHLLPNMNFNGHCLIKNNISIPKKVMNLYISFTLVPELRTLRNFLFVFAKLNINNSLDKYKHTG